LKKFFIFSLQVAMGVPTFSSPGRRGLVVPWRPSCIYKSKCSQKYLADSSESAREVVYAFIVCVCTQAMGTCWH